MKQVGDKVYSIRGRGGEIHVREHEVIGTLKHRDRIFPLIEEMILPVPYDGYEEDHPGFLAGDTFYCTYRIYLSMKLHDTLEEAEAEVPKFRERIERISQSVRKSIKNG